MSEDFFAKSEDGASAPQPEAGQQEQPKIKIGDKEFTEEELTRLVSLGQIAVEAEEKYDRPISKFWPEYTKSQQRIKELEEAEANRSKETERAKATPEQLSEEDMRDRAIEQAEKLGLVHKGNVMNFINEAIQGQRLLDEVEVLVEDTIAEGKPKTTVEDLVRYMSETGIRSPQDAYELKFKHELKALEASKLAEIKPEGLKTQESSEAGATKLPERTPLTKDNLQESVSALFRQKLGSER